MPQKNFVALCEALIENLSSIPSGNYCFMYGSKLGQIKRLSNETFYNGNIFHFNFSQNQNSDPGHKGIGGNDRINSLAKKAKGLGITTLAVMLLPYSAVWTNPRLYISCGKAKDLRARRKSPVYLGQLVEVASELAACQFFKLLLTINQVNPVDPFQKLCRTLHLYNFSEVKGRVVPPRRQLPLRS